MEPVTTALALTFASTALKAIKLAKAESEEEALEKLLGLRSDFSKLMPDSNDNKSNKEFAKQLQEMVLDQEAWKNRKESEKPTPEDVLLGFEKLKESAAKAGDSKKRRILFNAFVNSFKPEFYAEGLSNILWSKVEGLEYPDFIYLRKVIDAQAAPTNQPGRPTLTWKQEFEYIKRLEERHLIIIGDTTGSGKFIFPGGLAEELASFALEDCWKDEAHQLTT